MMTKEEKKQKNKEYRNRPDVKLKRQKYMREYMNKYMLEYRKKPEIREKNKAYMREYMRKYNQKKREEKKNA